MQYNIIQYNIMQFNAIQYNSVQTITIMITISYNYHWERGIQQIPAWKKHTRMFQAIPDSRLKWTESGHQLSEHNECLK